MAMKGRGRIGPRQGSYPRSAAVLLVVTAVGLLGACGTGTSTTTPPAAGGAGGHRSRATTEPADTGSPGATDGSGVGSGLQSLLPNSETGTATPAPTGGGAGQGSTVGSPSPQPAPTRTSVESSASFSTPSKNIACWMDTSSARCDINQRNWSAPSPPASCELDYGNGLYVSSGKAGVACAGDTMLGQTRILAYGQAVRVGNVVCASSAAGVRCADASTKHGFVLAKEGYQVF